MVNVDTTSSYGGITPFTTTATTSINSDQPSQVILRLRLPETTIDSEGLDSQSSVSWDPEIIDNENMNRKRSKKCCIYHHPRKFDESDSESEESENEEEFRRRYPEFSGKRHKAKNKTGKCKSNGHGCDENEED